ncbi:MAG TPA: ABC transporter permease [Thermoanaerobaculia bacterium]|nr:ABC transporter permease [Thermoanaerobaculia bacterium]
MKRKPLLRRNAGMDHLLRDLRVAARSLTRHPALAILAVVALSLGIGLTGAMFSIVHGATRELPFERADRLIHLERNNLAEDIESMEVPIHDLLDWREAQTSFEGLAGFYSGTANLASEGQRPERYQGAFISPSAFPMLRVEPRLGRTFLPEEEGPASPAVVILGHGVWQERFGGDPDILGRSVHVNSELHTVIGVMPEGFEFPMSEDLWLPLRLDPAEHPRGSEEQFTLEVFGRLRDGVSREQAALEMATLAERLAEEYPDTNEGVGAVLKPYTEEYIDDEPRRLLMIMLGAVFGVLLIACANVANLLLARASLRTREMAVRTALGARRRRVAAQFLTEALVLSLAGAALGVALAWGGVTAFNSAIAATDPPFWIDIRIALPELAFVVGLALLSSLLAGLAPALQASRVDVNEVLKDESRGSSGLRVGRFSKGLVVAEVALSCGLLVAAGLMIQSVVNLRSLDYGFASDDVFVARVALFENDYPDEASRQRFYEALEERVVGLPGVTAASLTTSAPGLGSWGNRVAIDGRVYARAQDLPFTRYAVVSAGFFETFGAEPVQGRLFDGRDREGAPAVAIANESFVREHLEGIEPLGHRVRLGDGTDEAQPWRTLVGVVPDLAMGGLSDDDQHGLYVPLAQSDASFMTLALRTTGDPLALADPVRREVQRIDPNLPLYFVDSLSGLIVQNNWFYSVFGSIFMVFGMAALFLATVGLYGVMSFAVSRRTHEVGIRMALGSRPGAVVRLMFRQGALQLAAGLLIGLGLALALSRALEMILFRVEPWDPAVFFLVAAALATTGALACLLPARRAATVDPSVALHYE